MRGNRDRARALHCPDLPCGGTLSCTALLGLAALSGIVFPGLPPHLELEIESAMQIRMALLVHGDDVGKATVRCFCERRSSMRYAHLHLAEVPAH